MNMKHYRVGVHTLVDLLYSPEKILTQTHYRKNYENGSAIHLKLGYTGGETFKRYYTIGNYLIEVIGTPDKINYKEACVEELKTYKTERTREIQKERGRLQLLIYSELTGLSCAKLILHDAVNNKTETIYFNFTEEEVRETVNEALRRFIKLREFGEALRG
ncbi:MAG: hypothetical protein LM587_00070 [Candidatus Aenigmarchaeota archaeon]|nr:hypothetical protein [Candidatus Aenigmarchaeota archaeon]